MKLENELKTEPSLYLKQHALNPVNWYPWSDIALQKAKKENKPILLSIGYSACHWCHVMAHESFEDPETARIMNANFINIKVDREERPDLDKIYQTAHALLTEQSGGWPLTIFLSPHNLIPFFSGTYFPKQANYGLPGFKDVLTMIANVFAEKQAEIELQNQGLMRILNQELPPAKAIVFNPEPVQQAIINLQTQFDHQYGGFGHAPKFPNPAKLEFLLRNDPTFALFTLQKMADGGIYDQLGGGFFRYSVDAEWHIPHFEKMLYDNGQLLYTYALAEHIQPNPFFAAIIKGTAGWMISTMQSPAGGYFASINADSEGVEGKFYLWDITTLKQLLTPKELAIAELYFGIVDVQPKPANIEVDEEIHLHQVASLDEVSEKLQLSVKNVQMIVQSIKEKLFKYRNTRIPPTIDTKILSSWNALAIKGMLMSAKMLDASQYLNSANHALDFLRNNLWDDQQGLYACFNERAQVTGYLDDYVFLIDALLLALELEWDTSRLHFGKKLANFILKHFFDADHGAFFFTADNQREVLYRPKTFMDEVTPSGNATAVRILTILGYLLGDNSYLQAAEKTLQAAWPLILKYPDSHCGFLLSLQLWLTPPRIIILRGQDPDLAEWKIQAKKTLHIVFAIPNHIQDLPTNLALKKPQGNCCAYICEGHQCQQVITSLEEFKTVLKTSQPSS